MTLRPAQANQREPVRFLMQDEPLPYLAQVPRPSARSQSPPPACRRSIALPTTPTTLGHSRALPLLLAAGILLHLGIVGALWR